MDVWLGMSKILSLKNLFLNSSNHVMQLLIPDLDKSVFVKDQSADAIDAYMNKQLVACLCYQNF